ncbi:MAG: hypothetical protein CMO74_11445 [Verrucomicrobiales bacterium]|nr:hypothetical protein [Verrucomicrobiales bacterium]|tara:strand:- start:3196 stop:4188 length:993 start_codon:yes stop_codon:yes gene_type:complete
MNPIKSLGLTRLFYVVLPCVGLLFGPVMQLCAAANPRDFQGKGLAKFATYKFTVDRNLEYAVNFGLTNLVVAHQQAFGKRIPAGFKVQYRIFGEFSDYEAYSQRVYRKKIDRRMLGYYSPRGKEIVTWRQSEPWRLMPTLQHEGCHAVMDAMYGNLPFWMIEGSADWFGEAPAWLQKNDKGLLPVGRDQRNRWLRLEDMRRKGRLPDIRQYFLTDKYEDWSNMFDKDIGLGYDIGWSIFDFFIRSGRSAKVVWPQQALAEATRRSQQMPNRPPEIIFTQAVDTVWPKIRRPNGQQLTGIETFEVGWQSWIEINARAELMKIREEKKKKGP